MPFKIVNARTTLIYKWDGELWFQNPSFRKYMNYDSRKNNDPTHEIDMSLDKKFRCPADNRKEEDFFHNSVEVIKVSIGYNYTGLTRDWKWPSAEVIGFKFAAVTRPAVKIAFIDSTDCGVNELVADYRQYWDKYGNLAWKYNWMNVPAYRHLGGAEIGFFDLHVEYRKKQQCFLRDSRGRVNTKANDLIWRPDDYPKD